MSFFDRVTDCRLAVVFLTILLSGCLSPDRQTIAAQAAEPAPPPSKNITIAVLGATGMVGGFVLQQALLEGYDIRALARTPDKLDALKDRITIIQGDARDPLAIEELLTGSDVIVSALGPVKADGAAAKMISSTATEHIIGLMPKYDIKRYLVVSGAAVAVPGDNRGLVGWLMQKMVSVGLRDTLQDKQQEYQLLADSDIEWTLVRCPIISAEPFSQPPIASLETPTSFRLRAGELAYFLIEQLHSKDFIRKSPFLQSR